MSGSLDVKGNVGKWVATTANGALGVSQSLFSFSVFVKVLSFTAASPFGQVFGLTTGNCFTVNVGSGFSIIRVFMHGGSVTFSHDTSIVLNQVYHVAGTINATGTSKIYINGAVVGTGASIGVTPSTAAGMQIGWNSSQPGEVLMKDAAVWNGLELTSSDRIGGGAGRSDWLEPFHHASGDGRIDDERGL
jgi:Concanavalin A-like lectin/glucanases superfamily